MATTAVTGQPKARPPHFRRAMNGIVDGDPMDPVGKQIGAGPDADLVMSVEGQGRDLDTPLMTAAPRADIVWLRLAPSADPDARNVFGKTALMCAAQEAGAPA